MASEDRARLQVLIEAVRSNLAAMDRLLPEAAELAAETQPKALHARALGSVLHDYYTGVERTLKRIVATIDGARPSGVAWHQDLLEQARLDIPSVRPPIVSETEAANLRELLSFRHLFRNVYGTELRWERLRTLATSLPPLHAAVRSSIERFLDFLRTLAKSL